MGNKNEDTRIRELIAELVARIDCDPEFDTSAYLREHPEYAEALERELARLGDIDLGFSAAPEFDEVFGALPPSEEQWAARYELGAELGRGGMGVVYSAHDRELGREVALKVSLSAEDLAGFDILTRKRVLARFLAEGSITAQLEHPGIAPVHEAGRMPDGRLYYTMKVVRGRTLADVLAAQRAGDEEALREFPLPRLVRVVLSICETLEFAHRHDILHRDLKPQNIMIGGFGEVQVLDWGLAKRLDRSAAEEPRAAELAEAPDDVRAETPFLTLAGQAMGSPMYMAPEQARGDLEQIDTRTDVFGLGGLLYFALSGNAPFGGSTRDEVMKNARAHRLADPEFLRAIRRVPRECQAICLRAMAAEREQRYPSVAALRADLLAFLEDQPGAAWRDSSWTRTVKYVRHYPTRALAVGAALVLLAFGAVTGDRLQAMAKERDHETEQRLSAQQEVKDRDFAGAMLGLTQQDIIPNETGTPGNRAAARRALQAFGDYGIPLAEEDNVEVLAAGIDSIESAELRETAIRSLYEFARGLMHGGHAHAWHLSQGREFPAVGEATLAGARRILAEDAEWARLWPRVDGLLARVDRRSWRREVWKAWCERLFDPPPPGNDWDPSESLASDNAQDRAFCGALLINLGATKRAGELLEEAVALAPDLINARMLRVGLFYLAKDYGRAVEEQLVVVALAPEVAQYRITLAYMLGSRSQGGLRGIDRRRALLQLRHAIELEPENPGSYVSILQFCSAIVPQPELVQVARTAVQLLPDDPLMIANYGLQLGKNDQPIEAIEVLEAGLERFPDDLFLLSKHVDGCLGMQLATRDPAWLDVAEQSVLHMEELYAQDDLTQLTRRAYENTKSLHARPASVIEGFLPGFKPKKER